MLVKCLIADCGAAENANVRKSPLKPHLVIACALLVLMGVPGTPRAAEAAAAAVLNRSRSEASLLDADSRRFRAMVDRDIPALNRALADELVYVHSSSTRQNKSEHIHDTEVGRAVYRHIEIKEQQPHIYGEVGVIQGVATFATGAEGHESTFALRYTDVYVKRDGRWQMVAWHCTRIPDTQ
ncbi:MAG: nuclear transport factor 2 family protein [Steroidobacteraceae bacterium]